MRIVIASDAVAPQVNGVVRVNTQMALALKRFGHDVHIVATEGSRTFAMPSYPEIRLAWRPGARVAQRLDALAPDAVHIATEGPVGWAVRAHCLRRGWPFTTHYHTRFPEYLRVRTGIPLAAGYAVFRRFHCEATRVFVPTATVDADLRHHGFRNTVVLPHGVDTTVFSPTSSDEKPSVIEAQRPIFLYVGRVAVEKNIAAFLDLSLPGTKVVCGVGPSLSALKAKHPDVVFRGVLPQAELASVYRAADVFVFPSMTDTFGLVLLEALACGTPVAAYPVPGPIDVIGESSAGALDYDLHAACLRALTISRDTARAHALRFSWDEAALRFSELLAPIDHAQQPSRASMLSNPVDPRLGRVM